MRKSAREKQRTRMLGCTGEQLDQCPLRVLLNSIESIQVLLMQFCGIVSTLWFTICLSGKRASPVLFVLAVNLPIAPCMASTTTSTEPSEETN